MSEKNPLYDLVFPRLSETRSITLADVIRGFLLSLELENRTEATLLYNRGILERFEWYAAEQSWPDFDQITTAHVKTFLHYVRTNPVRWGKPEHSRANKPVRPATVARYRAVLHALWNYAIRDDLLSANVVTAIRVAKGEQRIIEPLSESEIRSLLEACRKSHTENARRDFAIVLLMLDTGMRASELCGLTRDTWDVEGCRVKVFGKGRKERWLQVSPLTAKAMLDYQVRERPRSPYREIFLTREAEPMRVDALESMLMRRSQAAGIRHVYCHLLRHSFAASWAKAGGPLHALQTLLGHATPHMTLKYGRIFGTEAIELHSKYSPVERLGLRVREKGKGQNKSR